MEWIGWILWTVVVYLALSFVYGTRKYIRAGVPMQEATIVQTFFWWVIAIVFILTGWNKLHVLWIVPIAFYLGQLIGISRFPPIIAPIVLVLSRVFASIVLIGVPAPQDKASDSLTENKETE